MTIDTSVTQSLAIDPTQVKHIYANLSESDGLKQAAQQFEAIFLQLVLKSMNNASDAMSGESGLLSSKEQKQYRDMYDAQLSQQLSASGHIGFAEQIVYQMGEKLSEVKNKFKEMAEPVALSLQGEAFYQPLNAPEPTGGID